ncbi:hypothetical protein Q8A73_005326 [Channa argus]|nr:hypothetical protein Q8A73_005326 [Channa argus]
MEKFSVSVNIASKSEVTFILTYEELLQRKKGQYEILTRVKPKSLVQEFKIVTNIYEPQGLAFVDATATFLSNDLLLLMEKTVTDKKAHISFSPTIEQQRTCPGCDGTIIDGDFFVRYDVNRAGTLGDIQIVNGYFVHFFAPPDLPRVPKNVVFVIDRSGSMSGRKIEQTGEALLAILKDLHKEDYFALIEFDHQISAWKESLTRATMDNLAEAMNYVKNIRDQGATDINAALLRAVNMLAKDRQENRLPERSIDMIILLTDGMPNSGEHNTMRIQENGFYEEVANPLLSEVDLHYPDNAVDVLTTNHFNQLFNGSEIVVAGRLRDDHMDNFMVEVMGQGFEEDFKVQGQASAVDWGVLYPDEDYIFGDFTERLWAYLTIQQLLDTSRSGEPNEKANATAKALEMSLQYNFVTPLTSMVVTKPETEDGTDSPLIADKLTEVDGDPHFIIELPDKNDALCFNINDRLGTIFNLVRDPESGDKKTPPNGKINTYFWRFGIVHQTLGVRLMVSTQDISVIQGGKRVKLLWSDTASLKRPN